MDWKSVLQSPFFTVALPIVVTLIVSIVVQNKRMDELSKRIDDLRADMGRGFNDLRTDMNRQFDGVNRQFDGVNRQFDGVNHRLDTIKSKLEGHSERIAKLEGPSLVRST